MQDKLFRAKVRIGHTKDGKPIDKYISAHSKEELEKKKEATRLHFIYGKPIPKAMLFFEYAEKWYRTRKEPFISLASKSSYKSCFIRHLLPAFGLMSLKAIDATQLQEFVNEFSGTSKSQITLVVGTLKAIFSTAYAEGYIDRDPSAALIRPKSSRKEKRRPLTLEETHNILEVADSHPDGLILSVLYYLGLRRGEALGLKWGDFDFENDQVHIVRDIDFVGPTAQEGKLKTEAADRFVPIPPELKEKLLQEKGWPDEYVFHTDNGLPLSQATFKRKWCGLMLAANCAEWRVVPEGTNRPGDILKQVKPRLTPHYFRHNYVTLLYESGIDPLIAMKIVGHTDYQTTANIYPHVRDDMLRKATVNMGKVFQKRAER